MDERGKRTAKEDSKRTSGDDDAGSLRQRGEDAAVAYLERSGLVISDRHWECAAGHVDLVARDGIEVVLVEVIVRAAGTRIPESHVMPAAKSRRLGKIAAAWIAEKQLDSQPVRFDVVSILAIAEDRALLGHQRGVFTITP